MDMHRHDYAWADVGAAPTKADAYRFGPHGRAAWTRNEPKEADR
ncbi:hypothetical protein GCM10009560_69140 [Nonomuraea longicatena]|uniref:Uncharacterized protein n=1 Tax=Nonomuraea longicatena TaxID=83682 RepID=A0ABP4BEX6_9ACTN